MGDRRLYETTLELISLDDLFQAPMLSPFDPRFGDHSTMPAIEFVADEIYAGGSYRAARARFVVSDPIDRTADDVKEAIRRWASARAVGLGHDVRATRWRGWRSLVTGLVLFVVLIGIAQIVAEQSDDILATLAEGLEVAAWVVLWFPLDTLIYSVWQHRLDRRSYAVVRDMEIELEAAV